jgi:amino acid transporter
MSDATGYREPDAAGDPSVQKGYVYEEPVDSSTSQGMIPPLRSHLYFLTLTLHIEESGTYITSSDRRQVGFVSAVFLMFNRMVGTGIFATPSEILSLSGSVGLSLFLWVAGMLIAFAGMAVYMEFGTAIPRNGGEKNYLEYVYRKPKFLATAMYAAYVVLLGWAGSNSVIFGEYILNAAQVEVNRWNQRGIGLACITAAFLIHGLALNWGLRLQNFLGIIKLLILLLIIVCGFVSCSASGCGAR